MHVLTVVGARPQFIKAAPVSWALEKASHDEFLVHTGQHYDYNMSQIFFGELGIREPDVNLGIGSGLHGRQTGQMLIDLEQIIQKRKPDWVLVYGDTNSTVAGALAAVKLHRPVAHVEAGLRSFNREMPEEHNRVVTDHCADLLFCPTQTALDLLAREGITQHADLVGDTMYDAALQFGRVACQHSTILETLDLSAKNYLLATVHRPYNTDVPTHLRAILTAIAELNELVVFPMHPLTRNKIEEFGIDIGEQVRVIEPVGYLDMLMLLQNARLLLTDSGGMQKEAYFFAVPCVTLRPETEWVETVQSGWNVLTGADRLKIIATVTTDSWPTGQPKPLFGDGRSAEKIARILSDAIV